MTDQPEQFNPAAALPVPKLDHAGVEKWPARVQALAIAVAALCALTLTILLLLGLWEAYQAYDDVRDYLRQLADASTDTTPPLDEQGYPVPPCDEATGEFC